MDSLLSPMILFFVLGAAAAFARSDLAIPEAIAKGLSLYLMAAIGLKGGIEVAETGIGADILGALAIGLALAILMPLPVFAALRGFAGLDRLNAAAVAAHYGSVSVVTFVTGIEVMNSIGQPPSGHMVAVLAIMETPAIVVGLLLARRAKSTSRPPGELFRETMLNGSVVLLLGSFAIGAVVGKDGFAPIAPVFDAGFRGILCFFLLDMGLLAARRLRESRALTWRLAVIACVTPIIFGPLSVVLATIAGFSSSDAATFGVLAASASYIAVPAAMRLTLPEANPSIYLVMSLGLTFPVNIVVGIQLYVSIAQRLAAL